MFPDEITSAEYAVLTTLSTKWKSSLLEKLSFQEVIDTIFENLTHTLFMKLEDVLIFSEIEKGTDNNRLSKRDFPIENIMIESEIQRNNIATLLITRKLAEIDDIRVSVIAAPPDSINVNQNILKATVDLNCFKDVGFKTDFLSITKYIAYYLLSTHGKKALDNILETNTTNKVIRTLKIDCLKEIQIPFFPNISYVVDEIDQKTNWDNADKQYKQLDTVASLFESFSNIVVQLNTATNLTVKVPADLYSAREFGLLLAQYLVNKNEFNQLEISVVFESLVHYGLFDRNEAAHWEHESLTLYSPNEAIEGDIVIVLRKPRQKLLISKGSKIIYLEEL